jgi:hypothetical protein
MKERERRDIEKIIEASLIVIISYKSYIPATKNKRDNVVHTVQKVKMTAYF